MSDKIRLDQALVLRGLAPSREKAQALIMAGEVQTPGYQGPLKAGTRIPDTQEILIREPFPFVSRGALKLAAPISAFGLSLEGVSLLDVGISTGGFSDFALQAGAKRVLGVDVTIHQVDRKLQEDPRVTLVRKNARHLLPEDLPWPPDLAVMDLSFISILLVLPALSTATSCPVLSLIKPQFEAERHEIGRGGIVRTAEIRARILSRLREAISPLGYGISAACLAGMRGQKGNQEFFFLMTPHAPHSVSQESLHELAFQSP